MLNNSPYLLKPASVQSVMLRVVAAMLPGIVAYVYFFGAAILVQIVLASVAALAGEALMLKVRGKPLGLFLSDGSAIVTAWLIALTFPPIGPWWLIVVATLFAIVVVKQLYGGLGQNPFNPAMAAFCLMIVAFPQMMSQWPGVEHGSFSQQLDLIFGLRNLDGITYATPLDAVRTALHSGLSVKEGVLGMAGGKGWEWVSFGYLLGGLYLLQQRLITWHMPAAFLAALALLAAIFHAYDPAQHQSALFHLFSGGAMIGAFFIVTDPVSGATTPRGKLIFATAIGLLTWVIRSFGAFPDGIAFATLLMNICVPLIDMATQPAVFGRKNAAKTPDKH